MEQKSNSHNFHISRTGFVVLVDPQTFCREASTTKSRCFQSLIAPGCSSEGGLQPSTKPTRNQGFIRQIGSLACDCHHSTGSLTSDSPSPPAAHPSAPGRCIHPAVSPISPRTSAPSREIRRRGFWTRFGQSRGHTAPTGFSARRPQSSNDRPAGPGCPRAATTGNRVRWSRPIQTPVAGFCPAPAGWPGRRWSSGPFRRPRPKSSAPDRSGARGCDGFRPGRQFPWAN